MTVTYEVGGSSGGHLDIDFYVSEQSRPIDHDATIYLSNYPTIQRSNDPTGSKRPGR